MTNTALKISDTGSGRFENGSGRSENGFGGSESGASRKVRFIDLGLMDYVKVHDLQVELAEKRIGGELDSDVFLLTEHPPVYTLGRRGGEENLTVSRRFLEERDIPVIQVERGGNITYHGPGQLVLYPVIHLTDAKIAVKEYVNLLEEAMIRTAADAGVEAGRNPLNHGIWVGGSKIGSVGIAVRRGVSFHGLSFNVNMSLEPFGWINPCGLSGVGMTSLEKELARKVDLEGIKALLLGHVSGLFGVELLETGLSDIRIP